MKYKDAVNALKNGLANTKELKYEKECSDFDDIFKDFISIYNFEGVFPCVNIFVGDTEIMNIRYELSKLQITIAGLTLNNFFIHLNYVESIKIEIQTINIFLNIK